MKKLIAATMVFCAGLSAPLFAQDTPVVVELFTSQGCSSCPPADALLRDLARREDVIALALHVDYWDYIGWKDQFARAEHTKRQRRYARTAGRKMIYTPQMIVNGTDDVVGAHAEEIAEVIARHQGEKAVAIVKTERRGSQLIVEASPVSETLSGPLNVQVIQYTPLRTIEITRGENAGRRLDYANVVDRWTTLKDWNGAAPYRAEAETDADRPVVVLIQRPGPGPIVGAALAK